MVASSVIASRRKNRTSYGKPSDMRLIHESKEAKRGNVLDDTITDGLTGVSKAVETKSPVVIEKPPVLNSKGEVVKIKSEVTKEKSEVVKPKSPVLKIESKATKVTSSGPVLKVNKFGEVVQSFKKDEHKENVSEKKDDDNQEGNESGSQVTTN